MDLRAAAATRAAYGLAIGSPFPPAAERCALAVVLSIICIPPGLAAASAAKTASQMPRGDQR
jgi:hypothetical protein